MSNGRAKPFHAGVIFVKPCTFGFDNCFSFAFGLCVVVRASHFHITSVLCQWDGELSSHLISSTDDPLYFGSMMSLVAKGKCHNLTLFFFLFSWLVEYKHVSFGSHCHFVDFIAPVFCLFYALDPSFRKSQLCPCPRPLVSELASGSLGGSFTVCCHLLLSPSHPPCNPLKL